MDRPAASIARTLYIVAAIVALTIILYIVAYTGIAAWRVTREKSDFRQRHIEAKELIEFVYVYSAQHGRWPEKVDVDAAHQQLVSRGWDYKPNWGIGGAPTLILHGPFRTTLVYQFKSPAKDVASNEWVLSSEGSRSTFNAHVDYRVQALQ